MKEIPLTQEQVAIVDDEDYEELSKHKWQAHWEPSAHTFYAVRSVKAGGKQTIVRMHHLILGVSPKQMVDHIDHDGLHNWRENIRPCNKQQNAANMRRQAASSSQYKGVHWNRSKRKWQAYIVPNGKQRHLGYFTSEECAARAYDVAARECFGSFAFLNFTDGA